jgi:hypothetical protein
MPTIRSIIAEYKYTAGLDPAEIDIDIAGIMEDANNDTPFLQGKTMATINAELFTAVGEDEENYSKLKDKYHLVTTIDELRIGRYIRWFVLVQIPSPNDDDGDGGEGVGSGSSGDGADTETETDELVLRKGGFAINIKTVEPNKNKILCKIGRYYITFNFEDTIVFQKLSIPEIMVLEFMNEASLLPS